ncbi:MAG TPA: hypothetical protein VGM23_11525 [Armatimonadota bacterium]|jgi:hypothetical protein
MKIRNWFTSVLLMVGLLMLVGSAWADTQLTTPPDSIAGLRPGTLTLDQMVDKYGKPDATADGGMLALYGGSEQSQAYGWFMVQNPDYTVPDLAVETAAGSNRVDLVMALGYDGFKTEKGVSCFNSEADLLKAYGTPDYAFSVPVNNTTLRELYYVNQGISFDVAPVGENGGLQVIAIYVTYPEYMKNAITIRKQYIDRGVGTDITDTYTKGEEA